MGSQIYRISETVYKYTYIHIQCIGYGSVRLAAERPRGQRITRNSPPPAPSRGADGRRRYLRIPPALPATIVPLSPPPSPPSPPSPYERNFRYHFTLIAPRHRLYIYPLFDDSPRWSQLSRGCGKTYHTLRQYFSFFFLFLFNTFFFFFQTSRTLARNARVVHELHMSPSKENFLQSTLREIL